MLQIWKLRLHVTQYVSGRLRSKIRCPGLALFLFPLQNASPFHLNSLLWHGKHKGCHRNQHSAVQVEAELQSGESVSHAAIELRSQMTEESGFIKHNM